MSTALGSSANDRAPLAHGCSPLGRRRFRPRSRRFSSAARWRGRRAGSISLPRSRRSPWRCSCRSGRTSRTTSPISGAAPTPQDRLGPLRVTQGGLIPPRQVVVATAAVLIAAAAPGLYLVWRGGPVLAVLGLLAIAAAVTYTAGPKPFGYLGLGELFVFFFFGPVAVVGTAFVMTHHITRLALLASIADGLPGHRHPRRQQLARHRHRPRGRKAHACRSHREASHSLGIHGTDRGGLRDAGRDLGVGIVRAWVRCSPGRPHPWRSSWCGRSGRWMVEH